VELDAGEAEVVVNVHERHAPALADELAGERDRIAAVWPAVDSYDHFTKHCRLLGLVIAG
jgi:hypothetical protein